MIGIGNILGYFTGFIDLVYWFPLLGSTQMRVLCVISIFVLTSTVFITCMTASETVNQNGLSSDQKWHTPFLEIIKSWKSLPSPIQLVCNTQFLAWMGWFPFLFYSSSWISQDPRQGSFALSVFAFIALLGGFIIPIINGYAKSAYSMVWCASHWFFTGLVFSTAFVSNPIYLSAVVSLIGISWGISG